MFGILRPSSRAGIEKKKDSLIGHMNGMRKQKILVVIFAAILSLVLGMDAFGGEGSIDITSDRLDAHDDQGLVLFSGNVVAAQKDTIITSDELYLYYDKKNDGDNSVTGITKGAGKIQRIELRGNVTMKRGERTVTGDMAVFHNADQKIIITGNAVMTEGENMIRGEKVTVFLKENRGIVHGSGEDRVTATIYPDDTE